MLVNRNSAFGSQLDAKSFTSENVSCIYKRCPITHWLPNYDFKNLFLTDLIAGLSVGLMLVPQSIAHAAIANVPAMLGMYTGLAGALVYPTFASCKHLAVGTGAVIAVLTNGELDILEASYNAAFLKEFKFEPKGGEMFDRGTAACYMAFFGGCWCLLLGFFGLGYIASFLSSPVMNGSLCGAAFVIMSTQFKHLIGVSMDRSPYFFVTCINFFVKLPEIKWLSALLSVFSMLLLIFLRQAKRKLKADLDFGCIRRGSCLATILVFLADFSACLICFIGVAVGFGISQAGMEDLTPLVGSLPEGLIEGYNVFAFDSQLPFSRYLLPSFMVMLISFVLAIALAKKLGQMYDYNVDASQELYALGLACIAGSWLKGFPMQASLSRTMVNVQSGAQTGVASWICGLIVLFGLLVLKPCLYFLPKASLAAIIEIAALKLVDFEMPQWLYRINESWGAKLRSDWAVWVVAFLATISAGVVYGIMFGVLLSCFLIIERSTKPKYAILGRLPNSKNYRSVDNFPEALIHSSVIVVRFDANLHFANAGYFKDLLHMIEDNVAKCQSRQKGAHLKGVIVDMGAVNEVDASGVQTIKELLVEYREKEVALVLANLKGTVRSTLRRSKLTDHLMQEKVLMELHEAVESLSPSALVPEIPVGDTCLKRTESETAFPICDQSVEHMQDYFVNAANIQDSINSTDDYYGTTWTPSVRGCPF